jgi:hypothetical protein
MELKLEYIKDIIQTEIFNQLKILRQKNINNGMKMEISMNKILLPTPCIINC